MTTVYKELNNLFYDKEERPRLLTVAQRMENAQAFIDRWQGKVDFSIPKYTDPTTRRKDYSPRSLGDILANYTIFPNAVEERAEEYPVQSHEKEFRDNVKNDERNISINFDDKLNDDDTKFTYSQVAEKKLCDDNTLEGTIFNEIETVATFKAKIEEVIADAADVACDFYIKEGRSIDDTLKRIRALKVERVRQCDECGGPFYAHSARRCTCDTQRGIITKGKVTAVSDTRSACELRKERRRVSVHREFKSA